jgi:hypothetical protein
VIDLTALEAAEREATHYLLSVKWTRGSVVTWWGPNRCGYVMRLDEAGKYTEADALRIERESHCDAVAIPIAAADALTATVVFDYRVGDMIRARQRAHHCGMPCREIGPSDDR